MRASRLVMHVCILADHATATGGAPAVAIGSAVALARLGIGITVLSGLDAPVDPRLGEAGIRHCGLGLSDVWDRPALAGALDGIWNRRAAGRLRDALAELPAYTVLHLHQWTRTFSPSVFPVLLGSGCPLVVTLHDYFLACPNGLYFRFDRGEPCRLRPLSAACIAAPCDPRSMAHKMVRVLRSAATRAAVGGRSFDVVHVSDRSRATIGPLLPGGLRQHRIDNPVEGERALPATIGEGARIAFLGRLTVEKGAVLVAEAARLAGMPVLFAGEGPAEAAIRRANPEAEMLGWRSGAEIRTLLAGGVRAVAAPSLWDETGPLTVYEALAAGVPAIASNRSGAAEKIAHGETGFVVEPEVGALAGAFGALADAEVARRMGRAAHERYWKAPLSPAAHAGNLAALYRSILDRPRDAGRLSRA